MKGNESSRRLINLLLSKQKNRQDKLTESVAYRYEPIKKLCKLYRAIRTHVDELIGSRHNHYFRKKMLWTLKTGLWNWADTNAQAWVRRFCLWDILSTRVYVFFALLANRRRRRSGQHETPTTEDDQSKHIETPRQSPLPPYHYILSFLSIMLFSFSFVLSALIAGASASNVLDLDPSNFDSVVGKGKPALVEL